MVALAHARPAALALSCALLAASAQPTEIPLSSGHVEKAGYVEGLLQSPITRARLAAVEKLRSVKCRRLFSEFQDLGSHPLDDVLSIREETSEQHLWRMNFRDGSSDATCRRPGLFAFTNPGSLTVFICPAFRQMASQNVQFAAIILIHEELHSLGAGEAPMPGLPTTSEITARVEESCGWR